MCSVIAVAPGVLYLGRTAEKGGWGNRESRIVPEPRYHSESLLTLASYAVRVNRQDVPCYGADPLGGILDNAARCFAAAINALTRAVSARFAS